MVNKFSIVVIAIVSVFAVVFLVQFNNRSVDEEAQAQAITDAKEWRMNFEGVCGLAITPATHSDTGAKFTFSDTCIPPGWIAD